MLRSCGTCVMLTILRPRLLQRLVLCWCRTFFALPILQPSSGFRACLRSLCGQGIVVGSKQSHTDTHTRAHILSLLIAILFFQLLCLKSTSHFPFLSPFSWILPLKRTNPALLENSEIEDLLTLGIDIVWSKKLMTCLEVCQKFKTQKPLAVLHERKCYSI